MVSLGAAMLVGASCDVFTSVGPKGCDQSLEDNGMTPFLGGTVENGVYMSSPWNMNLIYFPGGMQVSLAHQLGTTPRSIQIYLAFDESGSAIAQAAGNEAEIIAPTDATYVTVENKTCSDYWLLVTAEAGSGAAPSPGGG